MNRILTFLGAVAIAAGITTGAAAQEKQKVTVFIGPAVLYDSIWMADAKGYFDDEGLAVDFRLFPSGTTALQTFITGQGDMVTSGELPGVRHWLRSKKNHRLVSVIERDALGYRVTARKEIKKPSDLKGKIIATRVGSTGSWFIAEYLKAHGMTTKDVTIKNLATQVLPTALCQNDISAFFIWQPFGARALEICPDKAHYLDSAKGYINGYAVLGARPDWLKSAKGKAIATKFVRAMIRGKKIAESDFEAVAAYAKRKYSLSRAATRDQWETNNRAIGFDKTFFSDHCNLAKWMRGNDLMKGPLDFSDYIWTDAVKATDPTLIAAAPSGC